MNNEFNNQNNMNNQYSSNYNDLNNQKNKNDKWKDILIVILVIIVIALLALTIYVVIDKKDNNVDSNKDNNIQENENNDNNNQQQENLNNNNENKQDNKLNYEVKSETESGWSYLYVNGKKVDNIEAFEDIGKIYVKEFNDLLIVDEQNPGPSRRLLVVDKNGNATEIDYKVSTHSSELRNSIDSYRIEGNSLYIKINRFKDGRLDWYCYLENKNDIAEYEVKYEYVNGKLGNRQVLNEITIANKYKNEKCD